MTPVAELPLESVSSAEAAAYNRWRNEYQRKWNVAFDPIALRIGTSKDKLVADMTVMLDHATPPQGLHDFDHLIGAGAAALERLFEKLELLAHPTHADAQGHAVAR